MRKFALIHTGGGGSQPEKNWLMHLMETDPEDAMRAAVEPRRAPPEPVEAASQASAELEFPEPIEPMLATLDRPWSTSATRRAGRSR